MKCPVCKTPELLMADRQGIEIDYCPTCRGVWLDRGELDKLIESAATTITTITTAATMNIATGVIRIKRRSRCWVSYSISAKR
jgi:uncharacterized protein